MIVFVSSPCSRFICALLLSLTLSPGFAASTATAVPDQLKAGRVRFALAIDNVTPVLGLLDSLSGESADFLRARLLFQSGRTEEAVVALRQVAEGQYHRGESALMLGGILGRLGHPGEAEQWFQRAIQVGFGQTRQQAAYELAELARSAGQTDRAGQILAKMEEGYWAAVGYLNLSSDYAQEDLNPSRALVALRVALAMAEKDTDVERSSQLTSRLLVRAGYLAFQNGEYDKAIGFLEKVPLDSYGTPQALYLHGLALAAKGNHRASMQSWHRAKKYPLALPGVANAWIGMGRGFDLSGYLGQAGEAYLAANAAYESERVTLRKLADRIQTHGAYKALVEDARETDLEWFLADSRTLTQPRMAYLLEFLQQPAAQTVVSRVAGLKVLSHQLERQARDLTVFIQTLDVQLDSLGKPVGSTGAALNRQQISLAKALHELSVSDLSVEQRRRVGVLADTLAITGSAIETLGARIQSRPRALLRQLAHAKALKTKTVSFQKQLAGLTQQAEALLDHQVLEFVADQDRRMAVSLDKTEQQIAHLYEYLALENLEDNTP